MVLVLETISQPGRSTCILEIGGVSVSTVEMDSETKGRKKPKQHRILLLLGTLREFTFQRWYRTVHSVECGGIEVGIGS